MRGHAASTVRGWVGGAARCGGHWGRERAEGENGSSLRCLQEL